MKRRFEAGALAFAAALTFAALACGAPAIAAADAASRYPTPDVTPLGSGRLIVESDAGVPLTGVAVFIAAGLDRQPRDRSGVAALVAECVMRTPVGELPLRDSIASRGGSIEYTVDGRSVRYYVEARAEDVPTLVGLLARALRAPDFSAATVAAARASLSTQIGEREASPLEVGVQMFRQAYYAGPAGLPALGTVAGLAQLGPTDLKRFYTATYVRPAVSASAVGKPSPGLAAALEALAAGLGTASVTSSIEGAKPLPAAATRIVAQRDVAGPWVVLGFAAPSPNSPDFGAMLVMEALLSGASSASTSPVPDVLDKPVGALYLYDATPAGIVVYVDGSAGDPSVNLRDVLVIAKSLAAKPLDRATVTRLRAAAAGQFLMGSVNLSDRAYLLGTLSSQGLGNDPMNAALAALERTTPADLQRVAKRYLQRYIVALVLPRQHVSSRP